VREPPLGARLPSTSSALSFRGTDLTRLDFEFDAGTRHTRLPLSIWPHVAPRASLRRQPVDSRNSAMRHTVRLSWVRSTDVSTASTAQTDRSHFAALTVDELKLTHLECDRRACQTLLGAAEAAHCSMGFEELKQRGFRGDFDRLLAWWQAQRRADGEPSAQGKGGPGLP
jgi:hypothetical protein